ncbi:MAG: PEP/pyruvate-binding domain-containing protein [Thermomicrobiales bacterium]|nr:PEP/pyruvate-binding domain-containing protein [Thermomicrobiales bacterium]
MRSITSPIAWLDQVPLSRDLVGGKGASLSELMALGAAVPPAFAVTAPTCEAFLASLGFAGHASVVPTLLPALREQILTAPLPAGLVTALGEGLAALQARAGAGSAVAVRSSATTEDGSEYSSAGQHDTILGVRTLPELETAVRQCWASLWSDRAMAYRQAAAPGAEPCMAVVVQQLIPSDVSFIAFTEDPVGQRPGHVVISAAWGLGEALVAGLVTPDQVVVAPDGRVAEYVVGDKHLMVIPDVQGRGTREAPVPRLMRTQPALSAEQAVEIAGVARALATRLGYAADLEGAIANDAIMLFQARPITTLDDLALTGD